MRSSSGLSLLEVVVAVAICGIVHAALSTVTVSSLRESNRGNHRNQATQVLDTVGRRIAGGLDPGILASSGSTVTLAGAEVDEFMNLRAFREAAFEVSIQNAGLFTLGTTRLSEYRIEVCYQGDSIRNCVTGTTLGRAGGP